MSYGGLDPFIGQEMHLARHFKDRKLQQALIQYFKPGIDFEFRHALLALWRGDLIGSVYDRLIPAKLPEAALPFRMDRSRSDLTA